MTLQLPLTVVLNPQAGRGLASREWPRLAAELRARGLGFNLLTADSGSEALAHLQTLPPEQPVLAVGGDGTVSALLPAFVETGRPLALIPLGSGNDFAGMLGLKPGDFTKALDRLNFAPRQVDALEVQIIRGDAAGTTKLLLNGMGMGFDAQVNGNMLRAPKHLPGFWRYVWASAATLKDLKLLNLELSVDGQPLYAGPSCLCAVMNNTRYGGGFLISPASDVRDAQLNALCSGPVGRTQLLSLMFQVLRGQHLANPRVHHRAGKQARLRWNRPMALHLDGDCYGQASEVQARILPGVVTLLSG